MALSAKADDDTRQKMKDVGANLFQLAPRVLINRQDVAATGLIQTGALVNYRLLIAGAPLEVHLVLA